jgi:molybdopterin molybdotransferase
MDLKMFNKKYIAPAQAIRLMLDIVNGPLPAEKVITEACVGRVAATDIYAGENLPGFARSSVDGYAVRSADTYGAKETMPAYLRLKGEIVMGKGADFRISSGEAAAIPTGGMLPSGADAVIMIENAQIASDAMVEILRPAAYGENVIQADEDIKKGSLVISGGTRLRPQDAGALAGLGFTVIDVFRKPVVSLISTGDEIVAHGNSLGPGQVRDINSFTLSGLINEEGGIAVKKGIIMDDYDQIKQALAVSLDDSDMVLVTGGTSVGTRDMTAAIIEETGGGKVLFHGVAVKPGRPLIGGIVRSKPVFGLPGHPAAVAVCFGLFVKPVMNKLEGLNPEKILNKSLTAVMEKGIASAAGREDHIRVRIEKRDRGYIAIPVLGKSGLIMTLVRADGVVIIPENKLGLDQGETVTVNLF